MKIFSEILVLILSLVFFHQSYATTTTTTTPTTAPIIPKTTTNTTTRLQAWDIYYIILSQGGAHHTRLGQEAVARIQEQHRQLGLAEFEVVVSAQVRGGVRE